MKLPVFKAFFGSLAYVVTHILTVFKILWLPVLLLMAAQVYLMPTMMDMKLQVAGIDGSADPFAVIVAMKPMFKNLGFLYGVMAILYPMMIVGMLRHVVRGEVPRLPFYFQYGLDEFRVLIACILLIIMILIIYSFGFLAVAALGAALSALSPSLGGLTFGVLALALVCVIIWFLVRMSIVFAAAVGERSLGLAQSWQFTKGNFWRLFFFWIFWFIVLFIVMMVFFGIAGSGYAGMFADIIASAHDPNGTAEVERRIMEMQRDIWDMSKPGFWPFIIGSYVFMIIYTGLWSAAGGIAYRYLSGKA